MKDEKPLLDLGVFKKTLARMTPRPWRWWTSNSLRRLSSDPSGKDGDVAYAYRASDGVADIAIREEDMEGIVLLVNQGESLVREIERFREATSDRDLGEIICPACHPEWLSKGILSDPREPEMTLTFVSPTEPWSPTEGGHSSLCRVALGRVARESEGARSEEAWSWQKIGMAVARHVLDSLPAINDARLRALAAFQMTERLRQRPLPCGHKVDDLVADDARPGVTRCSACGGL